MKIKPFIMFHFPSESWANVSLPHTSGTNQKYLRPKHKLSLEPYATQTPRQLSIKKVSPTCHSWDVSSLSLYILNTSFNLKYVGALISELILHCMLRSDQHDWKIAALPHRGLPSHLPCARYTARHKGHPERERASVRWVNRPHGPPKVTYDVFKY